MMWAMPLTVAIFVVLGMTAVDRPHQNAENPSDR
jgi:hypothetical protein